MTIVHTVQGNRITVAVSGDLDLKTAGPLRETLDRLLDRYRDKQLVLDLAEVDFVDSSGLGVILGRYRKMKGEGRTLAITGVKPSVRVVMEFAGLPAIIPITEQAAKSPVRDGHP